MLEFLNDIENERSGEKVRNAVREGVDYCSEYLEKNFSFINDLSDEALSSDSFYTNTEAELLIFENNCKDLNSINSKFLRDYDDFSENSQFGRYLSLIEGGVLNG